VSDLLGDYERKRVRAMLHYDVLRKQVEGFTNIDRDPVRGDLQRDALKHTFKVPLPRIDPDWAVLLGDFLYNTRASLDYLITALVRSTGKVEHSRSQFPIYAPTEDVGWENIHQWWDNAPQVKRQLKSTPPGTKAALKKLQPFYGVPRTNPDWHPLFALNTLNNRDKHRRLNLLARHASIESVDGRGKPLFHGIPIEQRITERDEGDAYTVTLSVLPDYANVDVYLLATYQVALDEFPVISNLVPALEEINQFIDTRVLPTVKALL
jgi:hypothetical protein